MVLKSRISGFFLAGLLVVAVVSAKAQPDKPLMSSGDLQFYLDKTVFAGTGEKSYVEFYLMFFADQIDFSELNKGEISINVIISNLLKKIAEREWVLEVSHAEDVTAVKTRVFYDQFNEYLLPGSYNIEVTAQDGHSAMSGRITGKIEIKELQSGKPGTSEIQFISSVGKSAGPHYPGKANRPVIGNPSRRFGVLNQILYFYYEIYNIIPENDSRLKISYEVRSTTGNEKKVYPAVELSKSDPVIGVTHGLNVGNLPSGIYTLNVSITYPEEEQSFSASRDFEIIQMDYSAKNKRPAITEEESEIFEKILSIIGTETQLKNYNSLNSNGKAAFLVEFWKMMDPSPGTAENEYLQTIQSRFMYANRNYGWGQTEGWKSERGRILIKYGNPDEIEQHHLEAATYPYEIWIYNSKRRYVFVFGDLDNNGKYVLLHSNHEGEVFNERWKDYLQKM